MALVPILGASYFFSIRNLIEPPSTIWIPHLDLAVMIYACLGVRLARLLSERGYWWQKFNGERIVGKELDQLAAQDCCVFHDFPLTANCTIDHVVVAPSGVYAVQSLYKRTCKWCSRQRPHEVIYDGKGLQFPNDYDSETLGCARRLADRLSQRLSELIEAQIAVKPVLGLPGWLIRRETGDRVDVLNEFEFHRLGSTTLQIDVSPYVLERIAAYLEGAYRQSVI
jgi:hypothetical protein